MKSKTRAGIACCALLVTGLLGSSYSLFGQSTLGQATPGQSATQQPQSRTAAYSAAYNEIAKVDELPDSPGASRAGAVQQQTPTTAPSAQTQTRALQTVPQKPVGTAAAEAPNSNGVAASQPAGVAIAPTKQRRVRTIVIRVGAIAGAAVAVGTVVALTEGTSSKPPGAR